MSPKTLQEPLHLFRYLRDGLTGNRSFALATVISRTGSAPREAGAMMAIHHDGPALGTIGGGLLEAQTLNLAGDVLRKRGSICFSFALTATQDSRESMVCGGEVEILIEYIDGFDVVRLNLLERMLTRLENNIPCHFMRSIRPLQAAVDKRRDVVPVETSWGFHGDDGMDEDALELSDHDRLRLAQTHDMPPFLIEGEQARYFIQAIGLAERVIIVGAGHVGRSVAELCPLVGFRTVVIDDRADFANRERFPSANDIHVQASLQDCFKGLSVTKNCYVVIATRGHAHDRDVLAQSLRTLARYIGMIGSKKKRDATYQSLREEGFSEDQLALVHCPIGLSIGAQTPSEIAVSIVAELIAFRAGEKQMAGSNGLSSRCPES